MEEPVDITPYLDQLDESLRDKVLQLQKGRWVPALLSTSGSAAPGCLVGGGGVWRGGRSCLGAAFCNLGWRVWAGRGKPCSPASQDLTPRH